MAAAPRPAQVSCRQEEILAVLDSAICKSQLAARIGIGWGTLSHHLQVLQRARLITLSRVGRVTLVAKRQLLATELLAYHALSENSQRRLLRLVIDSGERGLTVREAMQETGAGRQVIRRQFANLLRGGLLECRDLHPKRYLATNRR